MNMSNRNNMRRQRILRSLFLAIVATVACIFLVCHGFQSGNFSQRRALQQPTTVRHERKTLTHSVLQQQQSHRHLQWQKLSASRKSPPSHRQKDSFFTTKRIVVFLVALMASFLLFPRAAFASTLSPEMAMATASVTAAAPQIMTPTFAIASPISAAMELRLTVRLLYAALMGAALGKERSFAKHSAGVRTMSLVALGACAFTICSMYGFAGTRCDTARIAANVASGVGFIGAGVITTSTRNSHNLVHGLTTAATIWNAAAVGMACGVGLLRIATTSALVTLGILRLGRRKPKHQAQQQQQEQRETWASSQESHHPLIPRPQQSDQQVVEDEEDDQDAEVHDTSDWDENPHADEAEEQLAEIRSVSLNSDKFANQDDSSSLMEAVVRSAWRNSTDYLDTLIPTERTERQRRSSSNKDYGP